MADVLVPPRVSPEPNPTAAQTTPSRDPVSAAVACVALAGFGAFIIYMLSLLDLREPQWSRVLYLLNGVEAIAFAAAGYLFGREVNRGRAENAEVRAKQAEDKAKEKEQDANGLAVAVVESAAKSGQPGIQALDDTAGQSRVVSLALDVLRRR
ncbi:MAG TPA: hypothetical protein VIW92_16950 [Thermoanaerobaculia bacterium]